jgi:hypothetical protein
MWRSAETVALVLTAVILAYGIIAMALTIGLWALKELRSSRGQRKTRQRRPWSAKPRRIWERAVTIERKHLVETDLHIAECEAYIANQRDLIERAIQQGRSTEVAEETLEALEASLRALERQRQRLLERLKSESRW